MDIFGKLFDFLFKKSSADEWKALTEARKAAVEEIKYLKDEYKAKADFYEQKYKESVEMHSDDMNNDQVDELLKREKQYLKQLLKLNEENTTLKERIIFMKILNKEDYDSFYENQDEK